MKNDEEDYCYSDLCFCHYKHKFWPFGIRGDENIYDSMKPKIGRFVEGVFIAKKYQLPGEETP